MNTLLKILKWTGVALVIVIICFVTAVYALHDKTFESPYPDFKASADSAVIARGKYLAFGPAHCGHCHAPLSAMTQVEKGEEVPLTGGFGFQLPFGTIYVPNITPHETGIGKLSDKEIARTLRCGVGSDGRAIFDFMPFYDLSDDDLTAIISFLRAQQPVENKVPENEINFIGKAVKAFLIKPMGDMDAPKSVAQDTTAEYGKYLAANVANCRGCHSMRDMMTGAFIGEDYAGGLKMEVMDEKGDIVKGKHYTTPNLTPDPETGRIASWTKEQFIARFRQGRTQPGSIMPWGPYSRMTDAELTALYNYLRTVKPVRNEVPLGLQEGDPM